MEHGHRLTPEMTSRKLRVLSVIKRYYIEHGASPTLGEIAAQLSITRQRAHALVAQLALDGHVRRVSGKTRGIMLLDTVKQVSESDALLRLREAGWRVRFGTLELEPLTDPGLPLPAELDHIAPVEIGVGNAGNTDSR